MLESYIGHDDKSFWIDWSIEFEGVRVRFLTATTNGHTVHPPDDMCMENDDGIILTGKPKNSEKTCPSATLSGTYPTWIDPGAVYFFNTPW
jgi:hypothetical protein